MQLLLEPLPDERLGSGDLVPELLHLGALLGVDGEGAGQLGLEVDEPGVERLLHEDRRHDRALLLGELLASHPLGRGRHLGVEPLALGEHVVAGEFLYHLPGLVR